MDNLDELDSERPSGSILMVSTISHTIDAFLLPYAAHLRQLGWRVGAAANGATANLVLQSAFDELHDLPLSRSILDARGLMRGMRSVSRILERGYDIVHVHTPIAGFVTRAAIRRMSPHTRPAVAYTAHGFHFHQQGSLATNLLFLTAEKIAGRWTDRLIVINDADHDAALKHRIVRPDRLLLMPGIGVDTNWYAPSTVQADEISQSRRRWYIPPDAPVFVVLGELSIRKRPFDVVAALAQMKQGESHLVLVGDGPERPRVEATVREFGLGERVHLLGAVADVRPMIAASLALVLASSREGLPRSIMEALSMEVPVITTEARGNPDMVLPDAGIVVPIGDVSALALAMDRLVNARDEARGMGLRGRARMIERYDLGLLIAEHEGMYRQLLAERSGRLASRPG